MYQADKVLRRWSGDTNISKNIFKDQYFRYLSVYSLSVYLVLCYNIHCCSAQLNTETEQHSQSQSLSVLNNRRQDTTLIANPPNEQVLKLESVENDRTPPGQDQTVKSNDPGAQEFKSQQKKKVHKKKFVIEPLSKEQIRPKRTSDWDSIFATPSPEELLLSVKDKSLPSPICSDESVPQEGKSRQGRLDYEDYQWDDEISAPPHGPIRAPVQPYSLSWVREGRMKSGELTNRISKRKDRGDKLLNEVAEHGINETNYLIRIHEPKLYAKGYQLTAGHPGLSLAAFNRQKSQSLALSRFGYAALRASEQLSRQFQLSRQQALFGLEQVSVENTALFTACPFKTGEDDAFRRPCPAYSVMYRTLDGSCNNADNPQWGAALRPFARFLPPDYSDGIEKMRESVDGGPLPNPRRISATVHRPLNRPSSRLTMMVMQWGQFLDHDLTATAQSRGFNNSVPRCCDLETNTPLPEGLRHPDCLPITILGSDPFYSNWNQTCMEFLRSSPAPRPNCGLGPRDQINQVTAFLDASNVYGSDDHEMAQLRLWEGGMLRYKPVRFRKPLLPALHVFAEGECRENSRNLHCFHAGDGRVNEQPALASMHTLWLREHNRLVTELAEVNPHWNDDRLFFEARKLVIATMQKITYGEWLPTVLGPTVMKVFRLPLQRHGYYRGYKDTVNPTITNSVASAAFRFGHSLVQHTLPRCDKTGKRFPFTIKLHQELMNPSNIHNFGSVDRLMLGMAFENSQSRDIYITDELTQRLFQTPTNHYGLDLASINIQRGRDHGLPAYNIWREQCGLHRFSNWGELLQVIDDDTVGRLAAAYSSVNDIDLFTGGLAEKPVIYGLVGPTFACILGQQFLNLRRGDRFWFENGGLVSSMTIDQLNEVRKASLARVLCDNLDDVDDLQPNIFRPPTNDSRNERTPCNLLPALNLSMWKEKIDSDFHGFHYTGWPLNLTTAEEEDSAKVEAEEEQDIDLSDLKESELFFLDDEEQLLEDEKETILKNGYSSEVPIPFIVAPGDEEEFSPNSLLRKEAENTGYQTTREKEVDLSSKMMESPVRRPLDSDPGVAALTDHNYNNVMEHAYANTLFYRRNNP